MLAIVIPYYKISFFEETLRSLANQSNKNFKVYIGDDCSPIDPSELIRNYSGKIDLVYKRFSENLGNFSLTRHWERCVAMNEDEEWLMILGDDDHLSENYVEEFYKNLHFIKQNQIYVIRSATIITYEESGLNTPKHEHPDLEEVTEFFFRRIQKSLYSSLSEFIFSMDSYKKFGFKELPMGWCADIIAWFEYSERKPVFGMNSAVAYIRQSSENISRKGFKDSLKHRANLLMFRYIIKNYLDWFPPRKRFGILQLYKQEIDRNNQRSFKDYYLLLWKGMSNSWNTEFLRAAFNSFKKE